MKILKLEIKFLKYKDLLRKSTSISQEKHIVKKKLIIFKYSPRYFQML